MPSSSVPAPARVLVVAAVLLLLAAPPSAGAAASAPPWVEPFADAEAILAAAAERLPDDDDESPATVFWYEMEVHFESAGEMTRRWRLVYRVDEQAAVETWAQTWSPWQPWREDRPVIESRVIAPDGGVRRLDPETVVEQAVQVTEQVFSDLMLVSAPLPGFAVGVISEEQVTVRRREGIPGAGLTDAFVPVESGAVEGWRLVLDAPAGMPLHYRAEALDGLEPRRVEADGRVRLVFEGGPLDRVELEQNMVPEPGHVPVVTFSSSPGWEEISSLYAETVEEVLADAGLQATAARRVDGLETRRERVEALAAWLHEEVRYTGIQLGQSAIVPFPPATVLERGFGDCKDKSLVLIALLRAVGIEAEPALVTAQVWSVPEAVPGLDHFDHLVVHLPAPADGSGEEMWIDATDPYGRPGDLPFLVEGRTALVVREDGGHLVRTPVSSAGENLRRIEVTARLPPFGRGEFSQRAVLHGELARQSRTALRLAADDEEAVATQVAETFDGTLEELELLGLQDAGAPYVLTSRVSESGRALTGRLGARVLLDYAATFEWLSSFLEAGEDADGEGRRHELQLPFEHVVEQVVRVVPPTGFVPVSPPAPERVEIGPATLAREVESEEDGAVVISWRLDTGKRSWAPEEVDAARERLQELGRDSAVAIEFEAVAIRLQKSGRLREAVAAARRLVAEEPEVAAHRARLFEVLSGVGLDGAARQAARAAVEALPEAVLAQSALAASYQIGALGVAYAEGWRRDEAVAAYRRALELAPEDTTLHDSLVDVLWRDAEGRRFGEGADLEAAADGLETMLELGAAGAADALVLTLLHAGRTEEAWRRAEELEETSPHLRTAARAATAGVDEALADAGTGEERPQVLGQAAQVLLTLRRYELAAGLMSAAAGEGSTSVENLQAAALLRRTTRLERMGLESAPDDPVQVVKRWIAAVVEQEAPLVRRLMAPWMAERIGERGVDELQRVAERSTGAVTSPGLEEMPQRGMLELAFAVLRPTVEGSAERGFRVGSPLLEAIYLVQLDDGPRVASIQWSDLGAAVLHELAAGRTGVARSLLDWAVADASKGTAEDPLSRSVLHDFWTAGGEAGEAEIELAGRVLAALGADPEAVLPALEAARRRAEGVRATSLDRALRGAYLRLARWPQALAVSRRLYAAHPASDTAARLLAHDLYDAGDAEGLSRLAGERFLRSPDDALAIRATRWAALISGDVEAARAAARRAIALGQEVAASHRRLAFYDVETGEVDEETLDHALQAYEGDEEDRWALSILACAYAELDRPAEARAVLVQLLDQRGGELAPDDWYAVGRMAESLGERESALAAYARVEPPGEDDVISPRLSIHAAAAARVAALAAADEAAGASEESSR